MRTSPLSIKRQEFSKSLRGFSTEEVHSFLEKIASEVEELQTENDSMKKQLEETSQQLVEFRRIEKNLQDTLLKTQENSAKAIESTKKQTALMLKEAEIKASQMVEKAKENADQIRNSIISLREERDLIIAKLKAIVTTQSHLLEMKIDKADFAPSTAKKPERQTKVEFNMDDFVDKIL
ncbi:MAG: DivIVA domain-containing protein [Ignavibacteria bacterium]|nr:DivIVA domain-containing protein [Ignavibacteria bacterium]